MTTRSNKLRFRTYDVLEGDWESNRLGRTLNIAMIAIIASNVIAVILGSVAHFATEFEALFYWINVLAVAIFTVEYALRLWSCPAHPGGIYKRPLIGRLRYALTPLALIDLLAIAPFFAAFFLVTADLTILRVFRLLRLLKLSRYFPAMHLLGNVFYAERRALLSAFFLMSVMLVFSSSVMYLVERAAQPEQFSSIPAAMWWGMATLTTVGYGDVVPVTALGRVVGAFIALFGVGMFALPAAILASGFTREIQKTNLTVSWKVVAALPLFKGIEAEAIGDIASLLRYRSAVPGETIFQAGDYARSVFFIQSGIVHIDIHDRRLELTSGDYFGELALLRQSTRTGTAIAATSVRLLVLDRADFEELCEREAKLNAHIQRVATERFALLKREGDAFDRQ